MTFSERLIQLRRARKLSQLALGNAVGLTDRGIRKYESGEQVPSMTVLISLADYFQCSIDYLTGRSNDIIISCQPSHDQEKITPHD